ADRDRQGSSPRHAGISSRDGLLRSVRSNAGAVAGKELAGGPSGPTPDIGAGPPRLKSIIILQLCVGMRAAPSPNGGSTSTPRDRIPRSDTRPRRPSPEPSPQPAPTLRSIRASRLHRLLNPRPTA